MSDDSLDLFDDIEGEEAPPEEGTAPEPGTGITPDEPKVWSVTQVNKAVRTLLESSIDSLWIGGEVGQWTRSRPGHCYFTLKDDRAQLKCVMFARESQKLPVDPEEGMQIRVMGSLTLYEARGDYQLVVQKVETEGADGLWRLAFEKLRSKLESEGLLDAALKKPLPRYPAVVGVVTSPTGAALRDIIAVLKRRAPWVRVILSGSRVQGQGASREVASAIDRLVATGEPDVIIVSRGGGSVEDLWAFNEEPVARAIAASPIPVVSGVGHEVDVTIADLVADFRAPTPSAAAEAVVPDAAVLRQGLRGMPDRLARGLRGTLRRRRDGIAQTLLHLGIGVERRAGPLRQRTDRGMAQLEREVNRMVERRRQRLRAAGGRLDALSPLATLSRGYSVAQAEDGGVLREIGDFTVGQKFRLRVKDGEVISEVQDLEELDSA